jgi:2-hydroxychromene-2-carboxylate isomerase
MWRDMERLAAGLNLPFRRPDPFPQNSLLAARVALVGLAQGWGEDFSVAVYTAQFVEDGRIDEPHTLAEILSFMNVDAQAALEAAQSDDIKLRLRSEVEAAQMLGVFGAPSFTTAAGELFWGNDRLEQALAWAKRGG